MSDGCVRFIGRTHSLQNSLGVYPHQNIIELYLYNPQYGLGKSIVGGMNEVVTSGFSVGFWAFHPISTSLLLVVVYLLC